MKKSNEKFLKKVEKLAVKHGVTDCFMAIGNDEIDNLSYLKISHKKTRDTDRAVMIRQLWSFSKTFKR